MDIKTAAMLSIINERVAGISLADALALVEELRVEFTSDERSKLIAEATSWAEWQFTTADVSRFKIKVIKEIRSKFSIGLKEAKDITDTMTPKASWNWFTDSGL